MPTTLTLGRDSSADISIADDSVSRQHAELVLLDDQRIFVRDVGSANGTTLIRRGTSTRVEREVMTAGDEVAFGDVTLSFDALRDMLLTKLGRPSAADGSPQPARGDAKPKPLVSNVAGGGADADARANAGATADEVPSLAGGLRLMRDRGLLIPGIVFVVLLIRLMWLMDAWDKDPEAMAQFVVEFSLAILFAGFIAVYRLCGKRKPWTIIALVGLLETGVMAMLPIFDAPFCKATGGEAILDAEDAAMKAAKGKPGGQAQQSPSAIPGEIPGQIPGQLAAKVPEMPSLFSLLYAYTICVGLKEELMKMVPVFALIWIGLSSPRPDRRRWGVFEPLDAIVYACAAATAFILVETFGSFSGTSGYVGRIIAEARVKHIADQGALLSFPLAIVRSGSALTGHLAYSGYFAYFIGLGLLRPQQRERYWIIGWIAVGVLHGVYDTAAGTSGLFTAVSTAVAFFLLITAILNGRKISPTRDENFATRAVPKARLSS